jgi:hypothetical protein
MLFSCFFQVMEGGRELWTVLVRVARMGPHGGTAGIGEGGGTETETDMTEEVRSTVRLAVFQAEIMQCGGDTRAEVLVGTGVLVGGEEGMYMGSGW